MKKYISNISFSLVASILSKLLGGFSTFFIAKALEPANYGVWLTMTLCISYSSVLSLGTLETLIKQVPFYSGKGDLIKIRRMEDVVYTAIVIAATLILVGGLISIITLHQFNTIVYIPAVMIMVIAASISFHSSFFYYRYVAHQNFKTVGIIDSIRAFCNVILVLGFSYIWGLNGAAVGYCLTEMIVCLLSGVASKRSHGSVKLAFDCRAMWHTVLIGFPIMIYWWFSMLQGSVDRIVSISLLGKVSTGYYGIGLSIVSVILLLPQSISRVLYPRINEKYGETLRAVDLFRLIIIPTRIMSLALAGGIGIAIILMPHVFYYLPKYLPGLVTTQILIIASYFRFSITNGVNFLIATNRQRRLILLVIVSLGVGIIAAYGAVRMGYGIEGLAVSTCFSGIFLTLTVWQSVFMGMGFKSIVQFQEIVKLYIPVLVMLIIMGIGILLIPQSLNQPTMLSMVYAIIFAIVYGSTVIALPITRQWTTELMDMLQSVRPSKVL